MPDGDLPERARMAAEATYRGWRIGDVGEGRLHAALVAAAPLIWAAERERAEAEIARLSAELEHAKAALAGDHEGIRLWMLDCAALHARHRDRANAAEARLAEIEDCAPAIVDALRHALAYVEHVPHPSSQTAAGRYRSALAIIGTGKEPS